MGTSLTGLTPKNTYDGLIKTTDNGSLSGTAKYLSDGLGNDSVLSLSTSAVGIGTSAPSTNLNIVGSNQCNLRVESTIAGGGIDLKDNTTTADNQVGIVAFGDDLCFRSGGAAAGNMRLLNDGTLTLFGNKLVYFVPNVQSGGAVTIDSSNENDFCGGVYRVTGAVTITIDDTVSEGFTLTIVQLDANQCTVATTGTITLRNRLSHTGSAGQWATISVIRMSNDLVLSGDTA